MISQVTWFRSSKSMVLLMSGVGLLVVLLFLRNYPAQAEMSVQSVREVRTLYPHEWGIGHPAGLAYSANFNQFFLLDQADPNQPALAVLTPYEELVATVQLSSTGVDALNLTFDDTANRLLLLKQDLTGLVQIQSNSQGVPDITTETIIPLAHVGLKSAQGMAVDATGKFLFIFDRTAAQIVRLKLKDKLDAVQFNKFDLPSTLDVPNLHGMALNPRNRHLYVVHVGQQTLYELTQSGQLVTQYDLTPLRLADPQAVVYAPSADRTDSAQTVHLFIADSQYSPDQATAAQDRTANGLSQLFIPWLSRSDTGAANAAAESLAQAAKFGSITEVALEQTGAEVSAAAINLTPLTLVQTINTAAFSPPSPDPAGITYIASTQTLLISDSEVDEMPNYFTGKNLFGSTRAGVLSYTKTTQPHSNEPAGIAYNPNNGHLFISDDQRRRVFDLNPGPDGNLNTADDSVTSFSTSAFNSMDPEGLDYDAGSGHLLISDGVNNEVYRVNPGPNGVFDGVPAIGGDDSVTSFDTAIHSINDPEGVSLNPATGNLILVTNGSDTRLYEVTPAGALVETYDISTANAMRLGDVQVAPGSVNPNVLSYYLVDRRVDNNADPNENDGKIYEFASQAPPPTPTPTATPPSATNDIVFVSSTSSGTAGGISFADEDVLAYNRATSTWSIYFDGSDVLPTAVDVDGFFRLNDGSLLLSIADDTTVSSLGLVDDSDIVKFTPISLGTVTAGTLSWYFDGSDVELTTSSEDLDALAVLSDGRLVLSTVSTFGVTGLTAQDEDLVTFTPTQLGETTTGAWAFYFDGSDVGLTDSTEDLNGVWVDPANGEIALTTTGLFAVTGASGDGADIFACSPGSLGATTACTYRLDWDGSANGFAGEITDALFIEKSAQQSAAAALVTPGSTVHSGEGDDPLADPTEGADATPEENPSDTEGRDQQIFIPVVVH